MKNVRIEMMYRDGCNFKTCEGFVLHNKRGLSEEMISAALDKLISKSEKEYGIVPSYFGLPTLAPLTNEHLTPQNDYDHAFCTIDEYEFVSDEAYDWDISEVVEQVNKDIDAAEKSESDRMSAFNELIEQAKNLLKDGESIEKLISKI